MEVSSRTLSPSLSLSSSATASKFSNLSLCFKTRTSSLIVGRPGIAIEPSQKGLASFGLGVSDMVVKTSNQKYGSKSVCWGVGGRHSGISGKDGIIIVDHGSRRQESNLMLNEFVSMFKLKTKLQIVEPAHMELAEPSIRDAYNSCVRQGVSRVIVTPFFLFPGRHWHKDIPSLTADAAKDYPDVTYIITAPLGLHELLVDVLTDRIEHCVHHVEGRAEECQVCAGTGKCRLYTS